MSAVLEARAIRKQFPGVLALDGVSAALHPGEVLAIVGENGAGKSTLMKILSGIYQPDAGELLLDSKPASFTNVQATVAAGVSLIHQELNLAENLSVLANIFLGRETKSLGFLLDDIVMRPLAEKVLERVGLPANLVNVRVGRLAPGQKQLVEIARALAISSRVIIMDEPTSSLTQSETDRLYEVIDDLRISGVAVAYISHRLAEVKQLADRAIVLRDGKNAGELARSEITHDNLIRLMVGREMKAMYPRTRSDSGAILTALREHVNPASPNMLTQSREHGTQSALRLNQVVFNGGPASPISLEFRPGEVLGMAGLVGAGRTELAEAVFGLRSILSGTIEINGKPLKINHPKDALAAGLAMVPEDRRAHGLILPEGAAFNIALPNLALLSSRGLVNDAKVRTMSESWVSRLRIRTPSLRQPVSLLSGGNQQKVVFAKWLARSPKVLILDEPTRGVDVGARGEIYTIIDDLAAQGLAVWMISSDMEELLGMSDRIAVLHEGRLAGILDRTESTEETIMRLATGSHT